jgi:fusion and transport protein UGO1
MASNQHHHHQHYNHNPPNPLRPYYIPPPPTFGSSSPAPTSAPVAPAIPGAPSSYDILQDFKDYSEDYIDSPSVGEAMRGFLDQAILKYTSILISQPFEVAKTVLQCQYVPRREGKSKHHHSRGFSAAEEQEGDSEEEETKEAEAEENPWTTFEEVRMSYNDFY